MYLPASTTRASTEKAISGNRIAPIKMFTETGAGQSITTKPEGNTEGRIKITKILNYQTFICFLLTDIFISAPKTIILEYCLSQFRNY